MGSRDLDVKLLLSAMIQIAFADAHLVIFSTLAPGFNTRVGTPSVRTSVDTHEGVSDADDDGRGGHFGECTSCC